MNARCPQFSPGESNGWHLRPGNADQITACGCPAVVEAQAVMQALRGAGLLGTNG